MKYYYKIYGLILESDYEFHQFVKVEECSEENVDIKIIYGNIRKDIVEHVEKKHYLGFYDDGTWFVNWAGSFWIHDNREINFIENEHSSVDDAASFLPGLCLAILLWRRGDVMIHGACLNLDGRTIIISGDSGAGKSTLTTELIKCGARLMADDITCIRNFNGEYMSYPAFPALKLCEDQVHRLVLGEDKIRQVEFNPDKYEINCEGVYCDKALKVDTFFYLEKNEVSELTSEEITGVEKLRTIIDSVFVKRLFNEYFSFQPKDFVNCSGIANQIKIYRIVRPSNADTLQRLVDIIRITLERDK